jgi:hypothetical protein
MANNEARPAQDPTKDVTIGDAVRAPIIYFENAPTCGYGNGIVNLMLAASVVLPTADGGTVSQAIAVAHLRCNLAAAAQLRDTIDKALLIATPVPEGKTN